MMEAIFNKSDNPKNNINFIPCIRWVKRGVANENPAKVQLTKEELSGIIQENKSRLEDETAANDEDAVSIEIQESSTDEYQFEKYDQDEGNSGSALGLGTIATEVQDDSDDSEKGDDAIKSTDNLILVGHVERDSSVLEVYIYNEEEESLYVHHDIILPSFPLCLEWLDYEPSMPKGNYCAVGSLSSIIEVWDIDLVNVIKPAFSLGKLGNRRKNRPPVGHSDAVLALAWNKTFEHILASGSADHSVILWDMENKTPSSTITAFDDTVQCLEWHPHESQTLLAGSCDNTVKLFDCKSPENHHTWSLDGEAERLLWNPLEPFNFVCGTSEGSIIGFDCRKGQLWSVFAHSREVTGLAISDHCPGLLVSASPDEMVKTWDIMDQSEPKLVQEREFKMGNIHCLELSPDSPFVMALGGDNKSHNFTVFDLRNDDVIKHNFGSRNLVQLVPEQQETSNECGGIDA